MRVPLKLSGTQVPLPPEEEFPSCAVPSAFSRLKRLPPSGFPDTPWGLAPKRPPERPLDSSWQALRPYETDLETKEPETFRGGRTLFPLLHTFLDPNWDTIHSSVGTSKAGKAFKSITNDNRFHSRVGYKSHYHLSPYLTWTLQHLT